MTKFTQEQVDELNSKIKTAKEALEWVSENLHPKVAKASSFGAEDAVVMDIMLKINPKFRFLHLIQDDYHKKPMILLILLVKSTIF